MAENSSAAVRFDGEFRTKLQELLIWRRDVRRFRREPLPSGLLEELLQLACLAPSVGFSQPWRWVTVDDSERRLAIVENFRRCNQAALDDYSGDRASLYARLKLSGLSEAPVHVAAFLDSGTEAGHGLGRKTMPETLAYSTICAVHTLWLVARARGVGVGWVSILDPADLRRTLDLPASWDLIAYLCLGYPQQNYDQPELERENWTGRQAFEDVLIRR